MGVIMLDYRREFDRDVLRRLADAGCREVLLFDFWHSNEPVRGQYVFGPLVEYARQVRAAGLRLLVQTPVGVPLWSPREWFLQNARGQRNDFLELLAGYRFPAHGRMDHEPTIALSQRFWSYWNRDAEDYLQAYVAKVRGVVEPEGAVCIGSIGSVGEYFFPSTWWYPFLKTASTPWWHDAAAARSFHAFEARNPGCSPADWLRESLHAVTGLRLGLYGEKWLQYVPYFEGWGYFGNEGVAGVLEANKAGLKTILFSVFVNDRWPGIAQRQAAKYPTWGGAEGAANVVVNSRRARAAGLRGVVCGPLFNYGCSQMEPWVYDRLREANQIWASAE